MADRPGPRTATVFARWGDKLILFGGSGPYISHIKSRRSYYDIYLFDTKTKRWNQNKTKIKGKQSLNKRINHAGDVLGSILAVYGGYDSEVKEILDDLVLYDIEEHAWIDADIRYLKGEQGKIGKRSKLTVTSVFFNGTGMFNDAQSPKSLKWSRRLWFQEALQKPFSPAEFAKTGQSGFKYGIFIFGGFSTLTENAVGDLWLIQPDTRVNESIICDNKDPKSIYNGKESAYLMGYEMHLRATNISKYAKGRAPSARYAHQATSISKGRYLVISGGRNNAMFKTLGNIAMNDINLFNTQSFEWETLAMYGHLPLSRWNHSVLGLEDGERLMIFGGLNMTAYMSSSSLYVFELGEYAVENFQAKAKFQVSELQNKARAIQGGSIPQ